MAYLLNLETKSKHYLKAHHSFGRAVNSVNTQIIVPEMSKIHAVIEWEDNAWNIRDVSKNGTWLNDRRLRENKRYPLKLDDVIFFADEQHLGFSVKDLSEPCDLLIPIEENDNLQVDAIKLDSYSLLPSEQDPQIVIFYDPHEKQWHLDKDLEGGGEYYIMRDNDIIEFDNRRWHFQQYHYEYPTKNIHGANLKPKDIIHVFKLSQDEESTQIELTLPNNIIDLQIRAHHYLTLSLARYRVADAQRGLDKSSQGWVYTEQLSKDLGIDRVHLNIQIHRAKKQLIDILGEISESVQLIQRLPGKVRFAGEHIEIYKGDKLESALN